VSVTDHPSVGLKRLIWGDRRTVAGTVYGTIIVMSVTAVGWKPYQHSLWRLVTLAGTSSIVLWVAHVYSHGLGESLRLGRRLTFRELGSVARREYSIVLAAVLPVASIGLGAVGLLGARAALWLAFGVGILALGVQGVRYARLERLSATGAAITVCINLLLGLTIVAAEVFIAH
jgi:hypothetical protein